MPPLIRELITLVNRISSLEWRRLRIAVTDEELAAYREFIREDGDGVNFVHALRGVPLQIEEHPTNPSFILENLSAQPSPTSKQ
jgi:hypothetical protein